MTIKTPPPKSTHEDDDHDHHFPEVPTKKSFDRGSGAHQASSGAWLVSFTDVMALMLTFFVLLFSMSDPDKETWSGVTAALKAEFRSAYGERFNHGYDKGAGLLHLQADTALDVGYLEKIVISDIENNELLQDIKIYNDGKRLILNVPVDEFFDEDSTAISKQGRRSMYVLAPLLRRIKNGIEVEVYVPSFAVDSAKDSRWGSGLAYASEISGVMGAVGYDSNIKIVALPEPVLGHSKDHIQINVVILNHSGEKPLFTPDFIFED